MFKDIIVDYCLARAIYSYNSNEWLCNNLEEEVKRLIHEGWQPQGGISVVINDNHKEYYQAMVKYE